MREFIRVVNVLFALFLAIATGPGLGLITSHEDLPIILKWLLSFATIAFSLWIFRLYDQGSE